jgi:hypothetical protein
MAGRLSLMMLLWCAGCTQSSLVVDAFPPAASASPWVLVEEVWQGSFKEAAPALGDDAATWATHDPQWVWLARYEHERHPGYVLTARALAFPLADDARAAFDAFRAPEAKDFAGPWDAGCWTDIGVMFRWGRLVFDIFGERAAWSNELQSAMLANGIAKRMPPGAPEEPR